MIEQQVICPYTGLRPFTEEESLYYKGRDQQVDQITDLLEENKFLMVTGASGEGKSSLIYAGLIPNARAGFFKAKHTNWIIASFRPERNPVDGMAKAIGEAFGREPGVVETELRRGYSSLIDLYTNSEFYIDEDDNQWLKSGEAERKNMKRKAANLMILVDQFEEFFTNPENFYNEIPSQDSQIVVNLMLETARIALKNDLPVYVVCTMRSDYIGQCVAFRGLPEYIGFSQFFVPRLKRRDLKQVIEEPAILSGNSISQRLIERLVFDITEGVDQLPILQHALSQVWQAADSGQEEMDLIHYAMVGGMPADELPDEDRLRFKRWLDALPQVRQQYFENTGLNRVIEIHASILYEHSWEYYNKQHPHHPITQKDAKRIIALTFSCLTKIDHSRAVRNRMSLGEITGIINMPEVTPAVVADVLDIFRQEGNLFIRPFKTEDPATHHLSSATVLDITHESLIRNWQKLNNWANQEFEYYSTYLDLKKQLQRWRASKKSKNFLLPLGPLTYFENWYNQCKPNAAWIRRYSENPSDDYEAPAEARLELADIQEFIKRSGRKVAFTRAFMKYGPQRIATIAFIAIMVVLTAYYWYDAEQKQNDSVLKDIRAEVSSLMKSKDVGGNAKALPVLINERYEPGFATSYLSALEGKDRIGQTLETYKQYLFIDKHQGGELKRNLVNILKDDFLGTAANSLDAPYLLTELNKFATLLSYDDYYNPATETRSLLTQVSDKIYELALRFFKDPKLFQATIPHELNYGLQQWLTFGSVSPEKINSLTALCSPFETAPATSAFSVYYPKGSYEINGRLPNDFNGGYHTLASLYAALGDVSKVIQSFTSVQQAGQNEYFTGSLFNNYNHILGIFYQYGHRDKVGEVVRWLGANYPTNTPLTIYRNTFIRTGYISHLFKVNINKDILRSFKGYFFPNLCLGTREVSNAICEDYEKLINGVGDPNERNYLMAMNKKRKAMFAHKYAYDRGLKADMAALDTLFQQTVTHYNQIGKGYLDTAYISVTTPYYGDGSRITRVKRKQLVLYPDYMDGWFSSTFHSDAFFSYLYRNNLFNQLYTTPDDLRMIHFWLAKAHEVKPFNDFNFDNQYELTDETLRNILAMADRHPQGRTFDRNLAILLLANRHFSNKDEAGGMKYFQLLDNTRMAASRDKYEYLEKTFFQNQLKDLGVHLSLAGKYREATELAEKFEKDHERAFSYIFMADALYVNRADPHAFVYLDSVFSKSKNVDFSQFNFGGQRAKDYRFNWILAMSRMGGRDMNEYSNRLLTDIIEENKQRGIYSRVIGVAEEGNFYLAQQTIPGTLTETEELIARDLILWQACRKKENDKDRPRWKSMDDFIYRNFNYIFYQAN